MMKIAESADPDPDPHQNVMDPQHWFVTFKFDIVTIYLIQTSCQRIYGFLSRFVRYLDILTFFLLEFYSSSKEHLLQS
jgi:hypothetical protein